MEKEVSAKTFITELNIKQIRNIKNIDIKLSENERKHLFLTGKNGSGKTSVLIEIQNYFHRLLNFPINKLTGNEAIVDRLQVENDYIIKINVKDSLYDLRLKFESGNFIAVFFGDDRRFQPFIPKSIEKIELDLNALPNHDLSKHLIQYLVYQDYKVSKIKGIEKEEIEQFFEKIKSILKLIYKDENIKFYSGVDIDELDFFIELSNGNKFTFNQLAAGYSAIFKIIFEIILRTIKSPQKTDTEGIILIDEPETHLHIQLQKEIMPILTKLFPNIQFIIATHSPYVLNSLTNTVVYDLETHSRVENLWEVPVNELSDYYFNFSSERVIEIQNKVSEFADLIAKYKSKKITKKDKDRIAKLEIELDEVTPYISDEYYAQFKENQKFLFE